MLNRGVNTSKNLQFSTTPRDLYFIKSVGVPTTLASNVSVGDLEIEVTSAASISVGNYLGLFTGVSGEGNFYFGEVLAVVSTTITLDSPVDFAYRETDPVLSSTREMNVNGAVTPQAFRLQGGGIGSPMTVNINRLLMGCIADSAVDLSKFGDLAALTNGVVLKRGNSNIVNIFNVKTNFDLSLLAYDWTPFVATNPSQGVDGFVWRYTFGGPDKHDTIIELSPGEYLEILIQDDLSGLTQLRVIGAGRECE